MEIHTLDEVEAMEEDNNGKGEEPREWQSLTRDLIPLIAERLNTLGDFSSIRLVCISWGSSISPFPRKNELLLPLLLCTHEPTSTIRLFDIAHRRVYKTRLPLEIDYQSYLYSSNEFLITASEAPHEIVLTNVFTRTQIWLPTPPVLLIYDPNFIPFIDPRYIIRIILSPPSPDRFAVVFQLNGPTFGYCKVHGDCWAVYQFKDYQEDIHSMLFFKGVLYTVLNGYRLATVDLVPEMKLTLLSANYDTVPELARDEAGFYVTRQFLCVLAEAGDNLLMVLMSTDTDEVMFFRWDTGVRKWVKPSSLGGRAVFVSVRGFLAAILPCDGFWARPDCVYIVDTFPECYEYALDGTSRPVYHTLDLGDVSFPFPSVWIFPKMT